MCGLIYAASFKNKPINNQVIEQYRKQSSRGRQGFGVFDDRTHLIRKTKEADMLSWLRKYKSTDILFHHRLPTSTDNVKNACHPFSTQDYFKTNYILIHNGHISNASTLKYDHEKLGIKYHSVQENGKFNDSESLLWDIALYLEGKKDLEAYGGIAFICMAIKGDKKKLYFARNSNPLYMTVNKKKIFLASEQGAARTMIKADTLFSFDYQTKKLEMKDLELKSYWYSKDDDVKDTSKGHGWTLRQFTKDKEDKNILKLPGTVITPRTNEEIQEKIAEDMSKYEDNDDISEFLDDVVYDDAYDSSLQEERKTLLQKTYAKYMRENQGYYWACIVQLRNDIKDYDALRYEADSQEELSGILATTSILRSIKDMIILDPNYKQFNSRHPTYKDKPKTILEGVA